MPHRSVSLGGSPAMPHAHAGKALCFFAPCWRALGLFAPGARAPSEAVLGGGRKAEQFDRLERHFAWIAYPALNPTSFHRSNR